MCIHIIKSNIVLTTEKKKKIRQKTSVYLYKTRKI